MSDYYGTRLEMKILYIAGVASPEIRAAYGETQALGLGGYRKVKLISQALTQLGHDVKILSSAVWGKSRVVWRREMSEELTCERGAVGITYPSTLMLRPVGGVINCLRAAKLTRKLLRQFKPDLIVVYNIYLLEYYLIKNIFKFNDTPIILELEDLPRARSRGWLNIKPLLDQLAWNATIDLVSGFTAVNTSILHRLPFEKPKHLLPGIIDGRLLAYAQTRSAPFSNAIKTVGYFGGLDYRKGAHILLELVPRLPADWKLIVTGSGVLASEFERVSERYPCRLTFLGLTGDDELYDAMCSCDCTIVPYEQTTGDGQGVFPFKVFEFLVAGTHVIAPPLPKLKSIDVSFVQRWDGKLDSLSSKLNEAETVYIRERDVRQRVVSTIRSRYSVDGVASLFSRLIDQVM